MRGRRRLFVSSELQRSSASPTAAATAPSAAAPPEKMERARGCEGGWAGAGKRLLLPPRLSLAIPATSAAAAPGSLPFFDA